MSEAATPGLGRSPLEAGASDVARKALGYWWVVLVAGILWLAAALVILQFDKASITTVSVILGIMFLVAAAQQFVLAAIADSWRWLWGLIGVLYVVCGVICFIDPKNTFAGLADILGFLFLIVGIWWTMRAFIEKDVNPVWWLTLISGILMIILAFWTSGQLFITRAYTLLVFAGIWALMQGITDITRAFMLRSLRDAI
jgi:uncharacterized membrane protein HdeD (DUF308 family)